MALLEMNHIRKSFDALEVIKDISLKVEEGEVLSIIGPSGSGKSTLLHILGGVDRPTTGKVFLEGQDVFAQNEDQLAIFRRRQVGLIYQFYNLIPTLTVYENVALVKEIASDALDAKKMLEEVGLADHIHNFPSELSGGEQQRVAIARALINNPAVLFADEPSGNLDSKTKGELHKLFFDLRDKYGQTIIIVTHDPDLAKMCDRELFMIDGQFV